MDSSGGTGPRRPLRPGETRVQRADRNFAEILGELRVLQTGVQILFGFLLILAVQPRFGETSTFGRVTYVVTLMLCCLATALLMGPVAYHRALFAKGLKPEIVRVSNRFARAGMLVLFLAIDGAVLLVMDFVFGLPVALVPAAFVLVVFTAAWYVLPTRRLAALDRELRELREKPEQSLPGQRSPGGPHEPGNAGHGS
ncbi:DUF6328 family protein [Actinopolymorpha singaporensis]|uniref:Integral membrane protein n=1 Tax=Actinopolymorpha singaporensis TaxID=117157 RepID=A0A1H1Y0R0_9ACTN|nr:DUF6328 family protein [Actinopolymorpha singaporensis]SDT14596.1 hypothetical protein SAMN04489717_5212 [Actinopolymorpha singaporensis]